MGYTGQPTGRQRAIASVGTLLVALAVGVGLASGLDLQVIRSASNAISAITLPAPERRQEEPVPAPAVDETPSGKASAAGKHAEAAPVAAPEPKILPPKPPPLAAAPQPGTGNESSAGATPDPGPGSGAGGRGAGTGTGGSGNGTGGGTRAVWRSGAIRDRDYPKSASRAKVGGEVEVRFTIEASGRVTGCRVSRSSGDAALDATTCRLIEERFRFKPATDAAGDAVASSYGWRQSWWLERR